MANKKTMKDYFNEIIADYPLSDEHKKFLEGRIEQIDKKAVARSSKPNEENEKLKVNILNFMEPTKPYRAMDIEKGCGLTSPQKAVALLGQLVRDGHISKTSVKGITYFVKVEG